MIGLRIKSTSDAQLISLRPPFLSSNFSILGIYAMTTNKTLIAALGAISVSLLAGPVLALDAAGLYVERACIACHGAEGRVPAMDEYPKLAGQKAPYMLAQMKDIKSGTRTNSHSMAMKSMMYMISDEEMTTVSDWLGGLPEKHPL